MREGDSARHALVVGDKEFLFGREGPLCLLSIFFAEDRYGELVSETIVRLLFLTTGQRKHCRQREHEGNERSL